MRTRNIFILRFLVLINLPFFQLKAQDNQAPASTQEFVLPSLDSFLYNKIPTTNAVNPEPAIFSMFNMSASQLVTASVSLDEQSVMLSPFHLKGKEPIVSDLAIKVGLRDDISHIGLGFKWRAGNKRLNSIYNKNVRKYRQRHENILNITNDKVKEVETQKFLEIYRNGFIEDIYSEFNRSHFTLQGNASMLLFEIIGGDDIDANNDGLIDNFYRLKGFNFSGGATYSFSRKAGVFVNYNYSERRANPVEDAARVVYNGFSVTFSRLFIINKKYIESEEYLRHSFIPGLEVAVAFEYEDAFNNEDFAEDGIISRYAISPIFDLKISPLSQFRVSLPIETMELLDNSTERRLTAVIQYNLQISNF